jgi:hypothetical protein
MYPIDTFDLSVSVVLSVNVCRRGQFPARMPAKRGRRQVCTQSIEETRRHGFRTEAEPATSAALFSEQDAREPDVYLVLNPDSRALSQQRSLLRLVFETLNERRRHESTHRF